MFTLVSQQDYFYILLSHKESSPSSMSLFSYQSCVYSRQSFESGPWLIKCLYVPRRYTKKIPETMHFKYCNWTSACVTVLITCVCVKNACACLHVCVCVHCTICLCVQCVYVFTHSASVHMRVCGCTPLPPPPQLCV